jgi:hypothetical protein
LLHKATPVADKLDGYRISATPPETGRALLLCVTASLRLGGSAWGKRFTRSSEVKTHSTKEDIAACFSNTGSWLAGADCISTSKRLIYPNNDDICMFALGIFSVPSYLIDTDTIPDVINNMLRISTLWATDVRKAMEKNVEVD